MAMDGTSGVGGIPISPLHGAEAAGRVRDREARREHKQRFEAELERDEEARVPEPKPSAAEPRREPHPPADEDSGNALDLLA
jgi:hypothetical protein